MKARLTIRHQGAPQGAGRIAVAATVGRILSLLALGATCAPSREGRVFGEKVKPVGIDAASQAPRLAKHCVRHEVMVSITQGSIGGQVWNRGVSTCGPRSFTEGVRKSNGGGVVAGQVGVGDGLVAVVLDGRSPTGPLASDLQFYIHQIYKLNKMVLSLFYIHFINS